MYSDRNYVVQTEAYAERHYIKGFAKKYKGAWSITWRAVEAEIARIDAVIGETDRAETIHAANGYKIAKLYFRVAGTKDSAKSSGNRIIIFIDEDQHLCRILLVYSKHDIGAPNETQKWRQEVKANYPDLWDYFS